MNSLTEAIWALEGAGLKARISRSSNPQHIVGGTNYSYIEEKDIEGYENGFCIYPCLMDEGLYTAHCSLIGWGESDKSLEAPSSLEETVKFVLSSYNLSYKNENDNHPSSSEENSKHNGT